MFTKQINKVKFQDQQLDDYVLENAVLKSKLQSKVDALSIMSKELDKCSMDRDRFKVLVDQLKSQKRRLNSHDNSAMNKFTPTNINEVEILAKTGEQNGLLKLEVESLQAKLEEATGDIYALRKQLQLLESYNGSVRSTSISAYSNKDYEDLVQELERIHKKHQQMQLDYRATLDEKEEIVADREYYKSKVLRLNHQMSYILTSRGKPLQAENDVDPPKPIVDIDALVTENKYLHERITQLQVEKEILKRTLTKYKALLENRNKSESLNLKKGFIDVMTQKQVRDFLDINSKTGLKRTSAAELKSLCLGLFEALNDKSTALQHQRKTNQILANRINELEKTLESWCNGQKCIPIFPSQMLLDEFLPENGSVRSDEDHKQESEEKDLQHNLSDDKANTMNSSSENYENSHGDGGMLGSKTVLPYDLQELVKEALAEMNPKS